MQWTAMILDFVLLLGVDAPPEHHRRKCVCGRGAGDLHRNWRAARRAMKEMWIRVQAIAEGEEVML